MTKPDAPDDPLISESVRLPKSLWDRIADYRFNRHLKTKRLAYIELLESALDAADVKGAGKTKKESKP